MKPISVKVPLFYQRHGSNSCGLVTAKMLCAYYSMNVSTRDLKRLLQDYGCGIWVWGLGSCFQENLFNVTIVTSSLTQFRDLPRGDVSRNILKRCKRRKKRNDQKSELYQIMRFLTYGGKIVIRRISILHIRKALQKGCPPIVAVDENKLHGPKIEDGDPHLIIPVSIKGETMEINDPCWRPWGGKKTYRARQVIDACIADEGSVIFIEPRT